MCTLVAIMKKPEHHQYTKFRMMGTSSGEAEKGDQGGAIASDRFLPQIHHGGKQTGIRLLIEKSSVTGLK